MCKSFKLNKFKNIDQDILSFSLVPDAPWNMITDELSVLIITNVLK